MYGKVKSERDEREVDARQRDHAQRIRETVLQLSAEAGFPPGSARSGTGASRDVNRGESGLVQATPMNVKTPKFNGKTPWEVFIAQFELLSDAAGWTNEHRALQLALCLTEDAASCLLLLSREERSDYSALVGALQRRFGQRGQSVLLRSEFHNRRRRPGEPLRILASDIEYLCKRAYDAMPPTVQKELARDQFLQALSPKDLRVHTLLARPATLNEALDVAVEREMLSREFGETEGSPAVRALSVPSSRMEDAEGQQEVITAAALQTGGQSNRPRRRTQTCWGCGQARHLLRQCPRFAGAQGNGPGPV